MHELSHSLKKKGWSKKHITEAADILKNAQKNKHPHVYALDIAVYWISLLVAVAGNFIIAITLIPVLLALEGFQLYLLIIAIGISFGLLFELLIRTINHIEAEHHALLTFIVPFIALITFIAIVTYSNGLDSVLKINNNQSAVWIGATYSISFIVPYILYHIILKK